MPTSPNASSSLSGGSGITRGDLIERILRRLDDLPYTDTHTNAPLAAETSLTVASDATVRYQVGGWIDWIEDGTLERALITAIPNATTLTIRRGEQGTTAADHAAGARFRYLGRFNPQTASEAVDDALVALWPEIYEVRAVDWTIASGATPEVWYALPADCERVVSVWQRTNSSVVDLMGPDMLGEPRWLDSGFIGATKKGMSVRGVKVNSDDDRLHAVYLSKLDLTRLTTEQVALLTLEAAAKLLTPIVAGGSAPERRSSQSGVPRPQDALELILLELRELKKREAQRLREFAPRREHRVFRGGRHYGSGGGPAFPVKEW